MKVYPLLLTLVAFGLWGTFTADACVLCKSLERARDRFAEADALVAEATVNSGNGNTARAAQQRRRALTLRANACYNIRSSISKFGASAVLAKLALIWPDAPSADECDAIIEENSNTPGFGGGGGGGAPGGGGGAGGSLGGLTFPGPIGSAAARAGAISASGEAGTSVSVPVTLVGIDANELPDTFDVTITPVNTDFDITLTSPVTQTIPAPLTEGGTQTVNFNFDLEPTGSPGDHSNYTFIIKNSSGDPLIDWGFNFSVTIVGQDTPANGFSDIEAVIVTPNDGMKTVTDNSSPTTLDYTLTNTSSSPARGWAVFTQLVDDASKKEYPVSNSPSLDVVDGRASMPSVPAPGTGFPATPTDIPNAIHVPFELGASGSGSESMTIAIPVAGGNFCEDGMTVCCRLRLRSVNPDNNFLPPYDKWSQVFQQYIANQTPLETSVFSTPLGLAGKVDDIGGTAELTVDGQAFSIPIPPGATAEQVAEIIAFIINTSIEAATGQINTNAIPSRYGLEFTGLSPSDIGVTSMPSGVTPIVPIEIVSLDLVSVQPITVGSSNGNFPNWDIPVALSLTPTELEPATGSFMAQLQINGVNWQEPHVIEFNNVNTTTDIQFAFTGVPMPFGTNFITVLIDPLNTVIQQAPGSGFDFEILNLDSDFNSIPTPDTPVANLQAQPNQDVWLFHTSDLTGDFSLVSLFTADGTGAINSPINPQFTPGGKGFYFTQPAADASFDLELQNGQNGWMLLPYTLNSETHPDNLDGQTLSFQVTSVTDGAGQPVPGISVFANSPQVYGTRSSDPKESSEGIFQGVVAYVPVQVSVSPTSTTPYSGPLNIGIQPFVDGSEPGGELVDGFYHRSLKIEIE